MMEATSPVTTPNARELIESLNKRLKKLIATFQRTVNQPSEEDNKVIEYLNKQIAEETYPEEYYAAYGEFISNLALTLSIEHKRMVTTEVWKKVTVPGKFFGTNEIDQKVTEQKEVIVEPAILKSLKTFHDVLVTDLARLEAAKKDQGQSELAKAKAKAKAEKTARQALEEKAKDAARDTQYQLQKQELQLLAKAADEKKAAANEALSQGLLVGATQVVQLIQKYIAGDTDLSRVIEAKYGGSEKFGENVLVLWKGVSSSDANNGKENPAAVPATQVTQAPQEETEMDKCEKYFGSSKFGEVIRLVEMYDDTNATVKEKLLILYLLFVFESHKTDKSVSEIATEAKQFFVENCSLNLETKIVKFLDSCLTNPEKLDADQRKPLTKDDCASIVRRLRCEKDPFLPKDDMARKIFAAKHTLLTGGKLESAIDATEISYQNDFMQKLALLSPRVTPQRLASKFWKTETVAAKTDAAAQQLDTGNKQTL